MTKNNVLKLVSCYLIITVISALSCDVNNCGEDVPRFFKTIGMQSGIVATTDFQELAANASVAFDDFGILLAPETATYGFTPKNKWGNYFPMMEIAYACSPVPPISQEILVGLTITADLDFDEEHPAGSDLTPLFTVQDLSSTSNPVTVTTYLEGLPTSGNRLLLQLTAAPVQNEAITFFIKYRQEGLDIDVFEISMNPTRITG